jgi:hypothetical protein
MYKVTITGSRGEEEVYYMDEKTLNSMNRNIVDKVEKINKKESNKGNPKWTFDSKIY